MDFKAYLIKQSALQLNSVARLMYPKNQAAHVYLSRKLNGNRPWTDKDNEKCRLALKKIAEELLSITTIAPE